MKCYLRGEIFAGRNFCRTYFCGLLMHQIWLHLQNVFLRRCRYFRANCDLFSWTTSNWKLDRKLNAHYHSNPRHSDFPDFFSPLPRPLYSAVKTHKKCSWWPLLFENKILGIFQVFQLIRLFFQIYVFFLGIFSCSFHDKKWLVTFISQCQGQTISLNMIN